MTTNIDRAAEVIDRWVQDHTITPDTGNPHELAQTLADAGLSMPDLPSPGLTGSLTMWMQDDLDLTITQHDILGVSIVSELNEQGGPAEISLTIEGARTVALALLAAADYAERGQDDRLFHRRSAPGS